LGEWAARVGLAEYHPEKGPGSRTMKVFRVRNHQEYRAHVAEMREALAEYAATEANLVPPEQAEFTIRGFSYPARQAVDFAVDYRYNRRGKVNWRERLVCPVTGLNARMRAACHILDIELAPRRDDTIYITEQVTPLFNYLTTQFSNLAGSEYLGDRVPLGQKDERGVRNEDLTRLTFPDGSFSCLVSLDCFEHFADHERAFAECRRVLGPGGGLLWSVPFNRLERNETRARLKEDGTIQHLLEPIYHGDPVRTEGCLCFTHFGWEMLDEVRRVGFSDAYAVLFWSLEFGYLGGEQILFVARV
jgi:SAM-dependent methyltransferase